jgi:hypothetical protein
MPFDSHTALPADSVRYDDATLHPKWSEHVVTMAAIGIALLIVALIAVLMGTT